MLVQENSLKKVYKEMDRQANNATLFVDGSNGGLSVFLEESSSAILVTDQANGQVFSYGGDENLLLSQREITDSIDLSKAVYRNKNYNMYILSFPESNEDYLVLNGYLSSGEKIFIRECTEGASQAQKAANMFLLYSFALVIVVAIVLTTMMVRWFTQPLFELINITKKISNFDFSETYIPQKHYNELDDLGEHINEMSTTLNRAISQLKEANDNLKHDLEIREETENMRKEFVSNVSHELKTPIALIQGYAEGLQEGVMDDENSRQIYLDIIIDEANKMNRLVREMLILNQLEAGQMQMDLVNFNLTDIIDGVVENNKIYISAQNISYSFVNKEECIVHSDEFLVEQIITNFISNAIHYVMNENVIIVKYDFTKKGKVRVSVFNSGNNIAKKDIKHIWEKFYKADKARSREYGGSGIGLSVVKATMDLLKEKFGVDNLPNGVEFWFELPLAKL
ncbi:MAG: HAMP domain-containing histidine kinase [Pseudobutyrivibrio sp.]|nr:HAMP domain-containing histidine kinase [Pseudobutyrivibrio sp.]